MRTLLAYCLLMGLAYGKITIPDEIEPYTIAVATVDAKIPEGAKMVHGGWVTDEGTSSHPCGKDLVLCGTPGTHTIAYSGFWVHVGPPITVKDVNGTEHTLEPYLGSGGVHEVSQFLVTGTVPDPNPSNEVDIPGFFNAWANVVDTDKDVITTTGKFRQAYRMSAKLYASGRGYERIEGRDKEFSRRIEEAIGLEDRTLTDDLRSRLSKVLREIAEDNT